MTLPTMRYQRVERLILGRICLLLWLVTLTQAFVQLQSPQCQRCRRQEREQEQLQLLCMSMSMTPSMSMPMENNEERPRNSKIVAPRASSSYRTPNNNRRNKNSMTSRGSKNNLPLQSLNINLDSLAKSNQPGAASRAQELLQRIEALHQEGYYAVAPDIVSLNSVLNAWANSNEQNAAEKALQLLDESETLTPNIISFNTIILAFSKRGAAKEAHEVLARMESEYHLQPDTISYNSVLYAYAQANQPERAEALLKQMMRVENPVKPDSISFNTVLLAWSKSDCNNRKICQRAEELLKHMEILHKAGNPHVAPDVYSYTIVIQALSTSRCLKAASKALKLLESMEAQPGLEPNAVTYTTVMTTLSRCGYKNAAQEAQNLLDRMIYKYEQGNDDCKPDTVAFTAVISCWARGYEHADADEKALFLLDRMKAMGDDDIAPNALTYTSVLKALARSQKAAAFAKAEELLGEMEQAYQDGNSALEPTSIHYNVVMDASAKSPKYDKAVQADRLYQNMKALGRDNTRPNIISYNSILRACANTFGNKQTKEIALAIATKAFQSILTSDDIEPSSITFVFFMKAIRKLVDESKKQKAMLTKCFRYCCKLGLMNDVVLQQAKLACTSKEELTELLELEEICSPSEVSSVDLPTAWTHNAEQVKS